MSETSIDSFSGILRGRAFVLGDDVNTDLNCPGKYLPGKDEAFIAAQAFEALEPGFAARFQAVVAPSFGRQFFRNAINNGLPALECDTAGIHDGDTLVIDLNAHLVQVEGKRPLRALPEAIRAILREGGLIPFLRKYPQWEVTP